ncbi:MAG: mycofactocin biosynthesis glycosyltransferase MftF [Geobacteraceae bacterium]|nr:mycofactocin biosynthesis glycosyltransferase MftF [Geobacteraceae bacterium]
MNYRLRYKVELVERDGEYFLMSKTPLSVLRLNRSLAELVGRGADGALISASAAEEKIMEQLTTKGFAERVRIVTEQSSQLPQVSIVIPVMNRAEELRRCLKSLALLNYPEEKLQIIVVDDGSSDDSSEVARGLGALVVLSGGTGRGPAAARNVGAAIASGEILAFIDSDCTASSSWLDELVPAFADPKIVAVGGLVDGMCHESSVDHYENVMSSLSLGGRELSGGSGDDTFYLPSCNMLVRRAPFQNAGGFNDTMHVGEDVDLTWRLRDSGWTITYLPIGKVYHAHRSSIRSFMSRRFDYGTSEGMLQRLHPRRHKRIVIPPMLALILFLCLSAPYLGWWLLGAGALLIVVDAAIVRVRLQRSELAINLPSLIAGRLRALWSLGYYLSYHLLRYYAPLLFLLTLVEPRFTPLVLAIIVCAAAVDHSVRKPQLSLISFGAIYLLEQIAYGAGVFWGCLRGRTFASYRVEILRQMVLTA